MINSKKWRNFLFAAIISAGTFFLLGKAAPVYAAEETDIVQFSEEQDMEAVEALPVNTNTDNTATVSADSASGDPVTATDNSTQIIEDTTTSDSSDVSKTIDSSIKETQDSSVLLNNNYLEEQAVEAENSNEEAFTGQNEILSSTSQNNSSEPKLAQTDPQQDEPVTIPARTLDDGEYVIASALNGFKMLDVDNGSTSSGANVQLYDANGTGAQKWIVTYNTEDGSYSIKNKVSGLFMNVENEGTSDKTNVQQHAASGTDAQKWRFTNTGNGLYTIESLLCDKFLDVANASTSNGTNIWIYTGNGSSAQKWRFLTSGASTSFSDGVYTFASALDSSRNKVLDIQNAGMGDGANLQLYSSNGTSAQKFIVTSEGNSQYRITSLNSGHVLDVSGGKTQSGTNVWQYANNSSKAQKWYLRNTGDGTCYIVPANNTGNVLDISGAKTTNGTNVQVYAANATNAQKFYAIKTAYDTSAAGEYILRSALNTEMVLDVSNGSRKVGANIQIYKNNGTLAQKFIIKDKGNGFFSIMNAQSKHMLDVSGGSKSNRANVQQYQDNNSAAQLWVAHRNSNGTYTFINAGSSLVLDIADAKTSNGTNVQQYAYNGSRAQQFYLLKTTGIDSMAIVYSAEAKSANTSSAPNAASRLIAQARAWIGCKESDGSHKKIIDVYNSHKPLARNYKVQYTDAWCATFVSAVAIKAGLTSIIPTECGCEQMINLFRKLSEWNENDARTPKVGDIIFYDWEDSGVGDCKGAADHVGIVETVSGNNITVIEGNYHDSVARRYITKNAKYIRGFGVPKYA